MENLDVCLKNEAQKETFGERIRGLVDLGVIIRRGGTFSAGFSEVRVGSGTGTAAKSVALSVSYNSRASSKTFCSASNWSSACLAASLAA